MRSWDKNMYQSRITGKPHSVAYVAVFLDIPKPTLYRWMQRDDLPYDSPSGHAAARPHRPCAETLGVHLFHEEKSNGPNFA
jgi:hypothetical protein